MINKRDNISIIGFAISFLLFNSAIFVIMKINPLLWPFNEGMTVRKAYIAIIIYSPMLLYSLFSLLWIKYSNRLITVHFNYNKFDLSFYFCALISLSYSIYLLHDIRIINPRLLFPIFVLCVINSVSEEIIYRLVFSELLKNIYSSFLLCNTFQALYYSIIHFYIGGLKFGIFAIVYGLMLGYIRKKNNSILPSIICHFLIDLGCIGTPMLKM